MRRRFFYAAVGALVLAYPLLTQSVPVYQRLGALVLLAAIGASAWNLIGGYAGYVSVGHAVFFGAGAYSAIAVYNHFGLPPIAGVPLGALIAVLIAASRFYRQATATLQEVKSDVRDALDRVRRADDAVRDVMKRAGTAAGQVVMLTQRRVWPVLGLMSAIRVGASVLFRRAGREDRRRRTG